MNDKELKALIKEAIEEALEEREQKVRNKGQEQHNVRYETRSCSFGGIGAPQYKTFKVWEDGYGRTHEKAE